MVNDSTIFMIGVLLVFFFIYFWDKYQYLFFVPGIQVLVDAIIHVNFHLWPADSEMPDSSIKSHAVWHHIDWGNHVFTYPAIIHYTSDNAHYFHPVTVRRRLWLCREVLHRHLRRSWESLVNILGGNMLIAFLLKYVSFNSVRCSKWACYCRWKVERENYVPLLGKEGDFLFSAAIFAVVVWFDAFCKLLGMDWSFFVSGCGFQWWFSSMICLIS